MNKNKARREKRKTKIRAKIRGTGKIPRLSVFRSHKYIYAQLIDDVKGRVIVSASEKEIEKKGTKLEKAQKVGTLIGQKALKKKIKNLVFDRSGYQYHGRIKNLATGAKEAGLIF